jgi:hypothetical protein
MKYFGHHEIREARDYAIEGGQALHVWDPGEAGETWPGAPAVFRRSRPWAHLFDQNAQRLRDTAKKLGVRVVVISDFGTPDQHTDLCAGPLKKAIKLTKQGELLP